MPVNPVTTYSHKGLLPLHRPDLAWETNVALGAGTYQQGQILGQVTASKAFKARAGGATDGSQITGVILRYACTVDAGGNITFIGDHGQTQKVAPAYAGGIFACQDLVGLDATVVTELGGKIVAGDTTNGVLRI